MGRKRSQVQTLFCCQKCKRASLETLWARTEEVSEFHLVGSRSIPILEVFLVVIIGWVRFLSGLVVCLAGFGAVLLAWVTLLRLALVLPVRHLPPFLQKFRWLVSRWGRVLLVRPLVPVLVGILALRPVVVRSRRQQVVYV